MIKKNQKNRIGWILGLFDVRYMQEQHQLSPETTHLLVGLGVGSGDGLTGRKARKNCISKIMRVLHFEIKLGQ